MDGMKRVFRITGVFLVAVCVQDLLECQPPMRKKRALMKRYWKY